MSKAGPILCLIGGILVIVGGCFNMMIYGFFMFMESIGGEIGGDAGLEYTWITTFVTIGLGIATIVLSRQLKKEGGFERASLTLIIMGVFVAVGAFIEILPYRVLGSETGFNNTFAAVTLTTSLLFIDPYLIISGGIIDLLAVSPEVIENFKKSKI